MSVSRNIKLAIALSLTFLLSGFAQETQTPSTNYDQKFKLGFGINAGIPTDNDYDFALGGDVRLQYNFSAATALTLTSGFTNLFVDGDHNDLGFIPVKGGFKAFIWEDKFYVLGEVGAGFAVTNDYNETTFLYSPGIGYATKYIDLSLRYEGYDKFNTDQVSLRLAYGFDL